MFDQMKIDKLTQCGNADADGDGHGMRLIFED
jgi:hypothetical protein